MVIVVIQAKLVKMMGIVIEIITIQRLLKLTIVQLGNQEFQEFQVFINETWFNVWSLVDGVSINNDLFDELL